MHYNSPDGGTIWALVEGDRSALSKLLQCLFCRLMQNSPTSFSNAPNIIASSAIKLFKKSLATTKHNRVLNSAKQTSLKRQIVKSPSQRNIIGTVVVPSCAIWGGQWRAITVAGPKHGTTVTY